MGQSDDSQQLGSTRLGRPQRHRPGLQLEQDNLTLSLKDPRGLAVLEELIRRSDVLVQNLHPGALDAVGLTEERIAELNPGLIDCKFSGSGEGEPPAGQPTYHPLVQAWSGIVSITGEDGGEPSRVQVALLAMGTGMWTAIAVYEALRRREQTELGTHLELSLLETALMWLAIPLRAVAAGNEPLPRLASGLAGVVPYGVFPTADRHIFMSAGNDDLWTPLCTPAARLAQPTLGADTSEILADLGVSGGQIAALTRDGASGGPAESVAPQTRG